MEITDYRDSLEDNPRVRWDDFNAPRSLNKIKLIVVHHTGDHINDIDRINEIERTETRIYKYGCQRIPYHFWRQETAAGGMLAWCNHLSEITWHARNANPVAIGCAFVGNYDTQEPDAQMLQDLQELLDYLCGMLNLPHSCVYGHGELTEYGNSTSCPGSKLLVHVRNYRQTGRV